MIKPIERTKGQDFGEYKDLKREPVIRSDGLPTVEDWEKLLNKEGVVTGHEDHEHKTPCDMMAEEAEAEEEEKDPKDEDGLKIKGMVVIKKATSSGASPLQGIMDAMKPAIDLGEVDSRHDDIINLVESVLRLSNIPLKKKSEKGGDIEMLSALGEVEHNEDDDIIRAFHKARKMDDEEGLGGRDISKEGSERYLREDLYAPVPTRKLEPGEVSIGTSSIMADDPGKRAVEAILGGSRLEKARYKFGDEHERDRYLRLRESIGGEKASKEYIRERFNNPDKIEDIHSVNIMKDGETIFKADPLWYIDKRTRK